MLHAAPAGVAGCHAIKGLSEIGGAGDTWRLVFAWIGAVIVFEHTQAQTPVALAAFLHEYRIGFPVTVDEPGEDRGLPRTMAAYGMQGTPTLVLIDRQGRRRAQYFGHVPDLRLGAEIMALIAEREDSRTTHDTPADAAAPACDEHGCTIPTPQGDRSA